MFYHLRLSIWGAQMLELIGETYVDLRGFVQNGKVPELDDWLNLRSDGRTTGVIKVSLKYLDAHPDEQKPPRPVSGPESEESLTRTTGQNTLVGLDFKVW
jgi:hypothetical protein